MKKLICSLLALILVLSLCACGSSNAGSSAAGGSSAAEEKTFVVGICQLAQHVALDAATKGFRDALEQALPGRVKFEEKNASGESTNCATIINGFVSENVDLIMANATPALTAAASATSTIPILGTSVTAYGVALDIPNFNGTVGGNISGTSDLADLKAQAEMLKEWFPEAKKVGLLFCSAEANSRYQVDEVKKALEALGVSCTEFAFTDTNDLAAVTQNAADNSDVVYIPTDNTAANNVESIANILLPAGVPAVCGEEGICAGCGVCTLSISYYDLGFTTGQMAAKILTGEANISTMAIEYAPAAKKFNAAFCEQLGLTVPEGYQEIAK
ncbi:MAG: ABC transporter substrate-binding protein [Lachnospiraceae bacterium]|nr:ABC transporter substrate-binding protein [Lachnospiraceae bacterium]